MGVINGAGNATWLLEHLVSLTVFVGVVHLKCCFFMVSGYLCVQFSPPTFNWPPQFNWNTVESSVKHYKPNPISISIIFFMKKCLILKKKNRIVFQWNPLHSMEMLSEQIKKSTCPRTWRKWLSNVWNMPWVLHVKVTLEQCLMSNGLLGHWWPVAVQNVHSISLSPLMAKCRLYLIISAYGKMSTLSHYLPLWQNIHSIALSPLVSKCPLYPIIRAWVAQWVR